jgi:fibronectin-binding autotransporter adhesin
LGANTFTGTQTMPSLTVSGEGLFGSTSYTGVAVSGISSSSYGVSGETTSTSTTTAAGLFDNAGSTNAGNILLGQYSGTTEFTVDAKGDVTASGVAKFPSYSVSGTAPTCTFTSGGGTTPSCTLDTGSTNSAGIIIATTGTAPAGTGTITLTFSSTFSTDKPVCIYQASDAGTGTSGTWGLLAVMKDKTPTTASDVFTWTNATFATTGALESALTAAKTYSINYHCFAK